MKKTAVKLSHKLKQRKLKTALKARKIRKNNKILKKINTISKINKTSLIKRNILPVLILITGSILFYYSNSPYYSYNHKNNSLNINESEKNLDIANSTKVLMINEAEATSLDEDILTIKKSEEMRNKINELVKDTPMEAMVDDIVKRDKIVAAFLLGIGMKESKYGIYSPKKDGNDCYNYWGYRGKENKTASGYSCFDSPEHAVQVVGDRIEELVGYGRDTPEKMIVWKCGYSCEGHGEESVKKWIADVGINFRKLYPEYKFPAYTKL